MAAPLFFNGFTGNGHTPLPVNRYGACIYQKVSERPTMNDVPGM